MTASTTPFPQGTRLPDGEELGRSVCGVDGRFWIHATRSGGRALLMTGDFAASASGLAEGDATHLTFAGVDYRCVATPGAMDLVERLHRPADAGEATTFARALAAVDEPISGAIYDESGSRLITYTDAATPSRSRADVLGRYLTGGIDVAGDDLAALSRIVPSMDADTLEAVLSAAALPIRVRGTAATRSARGAIGRVSDHAPRTVGPFELAGRQALSAFFNEHVVDIVADEERYAAMGIGFPGGIILEGPTGCGKTFAVERLAEHLGWPAFHVEATTVASPYVHETSRKVAQIFAEATKAAPSLVIIDEMDAFLASRETGSQQHQVEEVAEFLRRIPEAARNRVLVIGMTNQIDAIDPAILRRGRFDHVIHVDHAGTEEVVALLQALLAGIPHDLTDPDSLARGLVGRPLSDVAFVVREAGRLAARARKASIGSHEFAAALAASPLRNPDDDRRIGF